DICNKDFYLIPNCDLYQENQENHQFDKIQENSTELENLLENAVKLKITGIIRPNEDLDNTLIYQPIGYTSALTEYLINYTQKSDVVKAQEENPDKNILTGLHFEAKKQDEKIEDVKNYISDMGISEKASMYQTILMLEQISGKSSDSKNSEKNTESTTEPTTDTVENNPLAHKNSSFSGNFTGLNYLSSNSGAVISLSEFENQEQQIATTEPITEPVTENTGISISDFSLVKTPDKTIYTIGEELDLTGGIVHDSVIITNQNGESELLDTYQYMTNQEYSLDLEAFDNTRAGIYPVYLVKHYIDVNNQPATEKILFYVLVKEPQIIQDITDPTEMLTTEIEFTTTETSETNIFSTDPIETNIFPTDFTMPTMPTGNNSGNNFNSDMLQQYLQSQTGQNSSNFNSDMLQQYLQSQTGQNSSNFNSDMMQQYLQSQYANSSNSTGNLSQQDLASMYASMMTGNDSSNLSQQELASMYSAMQGNTNATAGNTDISGNLSQQDLASLYSAMQNNQTTTETSGNISQEDLAAMYSAMQNNQDFSQYSQYGNFSSEDIEKMMNISNLSETELANALDEYMQNPDEDILLEIYEQ
ncbi:MAG: bacterial Ig-like domain-containing protein, partial [Oscillospiraceae bacterium]|nr:bacterial Ig-like domain-containing protein [Oscillospiraceae bacterium]